MINQKVVSILSAAAVCCCLGTGTAFAQDPNGTATVTYEVSSITQLAVSGSASVTITTGTVGVGLTAAENTNGVTYSVSNNAGSNSKKLMGKINSVMPDNTTLSVNVAAPTGASTNNYVALTISDQALVTGIDNVAEADIAISFKLEATVAAGVIASAQKTFTLTITAS